MSIVFNTDSSCPQFKPKSDENIDFGEFPSQPDLEGFEKAGLGRLHLSSIVTEDLLQLYTRLEISEDRVNNLEDSFDRDLFVTTVAPPVISSAGKILEGRGRIKAALKRQEKYIPVFIYDPVDTSAGRIFKTSLTFNDPAPENNKEPNSLRDYALTVRRLVELGTEKGGIDDNPTAVTDLLHELNWFLRWPREATRTTLRNMIDSELGAFRNGDTMVLRKMESEVKLWITKNYSGSKNYVLVCMDNTRYARSIILENIFKAVKNGDDPVRIILYTKRHTSSDAIKNLKSFVSYLDKLYESIFEHVGTMQLRDKEISTFLNMFHPDKKTLITSYNLENRPYVVVGCVPQVKEYHLLDSDKLVKVEDYDKKIEPIVIKKKKTVATDFITIDDALGIDSYGEDND